MDGITDLSILQVASASVFALILLIIVRKKGLSREKIILISSIRMTLQLIITGNILIYIFDNPSPFFTIFIILIMQVFAIFNIYKRAGKPLSTALKKIIAVSMLTGTLSCISYFLFVVVRVSPWYDPRYFIPIAGMLIGNSMTGISLGVNRLTDGMEDKKTIIESALMLGADPKTASKEIIDTSFDSAILPTINSMLGMGIVFLPGMMTGQILSGTSPLTAISYQIAIMFGILGSVSLTVLIFVQLGYKTYFNHRYQFVSETKEKQKK